MKIYILYLLVVLPLNMIQPNPQGNPNGNGKGLDNPNNPNSDNPVPMNGVEILIISGIALGLYGVYKKSNK